MSRDPAYLTFEQYLTVKQASEFLGVSAGTLRNWDRAGKLRARRHPVNGYRLYRRPELEALLAQLNPHDGGEIPDER